MIMDKVAVLLCILRKKYNKKLNNATNNNLDLLFIKK